MVIQQANQFCSAHSFLDRPGRRSALKIIWLAGCLPVRSVLQLETCGSTKLYTYDNEAI